MFFEGHASIAASPSFLGCQHEKPWYRSNSVVLRAPSRASDTNNTFGEYCRLFLVNGQTFCLFHSIPRSIFHSILISVPM